LLLTVLGELVVPSGDAVWTASLLYVLNCLGITEPAARQGLARSADAGWLEGERVGREVRWRPTPMVLETLSDITQRVISLSSAPDQWDGNGLFLNVMIPREKKDVRKRLYSALGWAGFGNPMPGLWATPHVERLDEAKAIIDELGLRELSIVSIGRLAGTGLAAPEIIAQAWDLKQVARRYTQLLEKFEDLTPDPGDDLLINYLMLAYEWRKFPAMDPQLPHDVLPDWIGRRAADVFVGLRNRWGPGARERWAEVVDATAPRRSRVSI
jgi:phenylacetic acid degradation operon negative regulatory protein